MSDYSDVQPIDRSRAYTWHGSLSISDNFSGRSMSDSVMKMESVSPDGPASLKKPWSRRNAWGSLSYADLISRAIESTAEKRMTLAQIYEWMVQNVPYFRDKGQANSSAGWKNSIRHNLSLHRRFKRVPNDDPGKSSWWMLNDIQGATGQMPRKRTLSIDKCDLKPSPPATNNTFPRAPRFSDPHEPSMTSTSCFDAITPTWSSTAQTCIHAGTIPNVERADAGGQVTQLTPLQWHQPTLLEKVTQLSSWHQPVTSAPASGEQYNVADSVFDEIYPTLPCTPLAPISELLSPPTQFMAYETLSSELPSPPTYATYASVHSMVTGNQNPMLSQNSTNVGNSSSDSPSFELSSARPSTSKQISLETFMSIAAAGAEGATSTSSQWSSGYSMLRQMLSQSHRQNAIMHGVAAGEVIGQAQSNDVSRVSQLYAGVDGPQPISSDGDATHSLPLQLTLPHTLDNGILEGFSNTEPAKDDVDGMEENLIYSAGPTCRENVEFQLEVKQENLMEDLFSDRSESDRICHVDATWTHNMDLAMAVTSASEAHNNNKCEAVSVKAE